MMAAVVTRKVPALEELPKASAALGQKAQLHSLQLVSDALGSSGRRLGQITFFSAGILTDTCPSHCPSCRWPVCKVTPGPSKQHHAPREYEPLGGDASEFARFVIQRRGPSAFKSTRSRHGPDTAESTRRHEKSIEAKETR